MTITTIIFLVLLGFLLLFIEFFIIPGITVFGVAGIISIISAIVLAFIKLSPKIGFISLVLTIFVLICLTYYAFRAKTWNKLALNTAINGKIDEENLSKIKIGDKGIAFTRLAPMGKIKMNGEIFEAKTDASYVEAHSEIEIINIIDNKLIVKTINN